MSNDEQVQAIKYLGEQIGYGNLMHLASALWMQELDNTGTPKSGAFIPVCSFQIKKQYLDGVNESLRLYSILTTPGKR